jgi:hypothetical protein
MYSDDDPYLTELRELCLSFPEAIEVEAWGRPTFRAKKIFATFAGDEARPYGVQFLPEPDDREALLQDPRIYVPKYTGAYGWLTLHLDAAPVDWQEVGELVEGSYRQVALKRMLKALDDREAAR